MLSKLSSNIIIKKIVIVQMENTPISKTKYAAIAIDLAIDATGRGKRNAAFAPIISLCFKVDACPAALKHRFRMDVLLLLFFFFL